MKNILKLIRFPYLVAIALTQLAIFFFVVSPVANMAGVPADKVFPMPILILLVVASIFTAAAGYVINDYYDVKIDEINHPLKHLVGKSISKHTTMAIFIVLSVVAILTGASIGLYALVELDVPFSLASTYMLLFPVLMGILWFYSSSYKRFLVLGNFMASALYALIPMLVPVYFNFFLTMKFGAAADVIDFSHRLFFIVACFSFCVFMWIFVAEVADDFEEEKGDRELECHSFPIVWGHTVAKAIMFAAILLFNAVCAHVVFRMLPTISIELMPSMRYYICAMLVPSIGVGYLLAKANVREDYKNVSFVAKIIAVLCVAYSVVFYFTYGNV